MYEELDTTAYYKILYSNDGKRIWDEISERFFDLSEAVCVAAHSGYRYAKIVLVTETKVFETQE